MRSTARVLLAAWIAAVAVPGAAQQDRKSDDKRDTPSSASGSPSLGLDRLLNPKVGPSSPASALRPGGKDRETWERQFRDAYTEVGELRARVEESQRKMRDVAGDTSYSYSPAGGGETYDPEVLKVRAQIQRDRQSLEAAERRLRDLKVEASLAGVPEEWQLPRNGAEPATSEPGTAAK